LKLYIVFDSMLQKQSKWTVIIVSHLALSLIFFFLFLLFEWFFKFFVAIKILKKYIFADNAKGTFKSFQKSNLSSTNVPVFTCLRFKLLSWNSVSNFKGNAILFEKYFFHLLSIERKISRTIFFGGRHFLNLFYKMECKFLKCDSRYNFCFPWNQMQPFIFKGWILSNASSFIFCLFCGIHSKSFSSQVKKLFSVEKFEKRLVVNIFCKLISS